MADYGELGYLMGQRQRAANPGAQSLGFLLGGGGAARQAQIFNQAAYRGAQMQDVMAQARQRQQSAIARQNLAEQMRQSGDPEQMLLGQMVLASGPNINPSEFAKARETALKMKIQQELYDRAHTTDGKPVDWNSLNALGMAFDPKPQQVTKVEGDQILNPYVTPDSQTPRTTDIGKARIQELGSLVGEHAAQAAHAYAGADLEKARTDEVLGKGPAAAKRTGLTAAQEKIFRKPVMEADGTQKVDAQGRPIFADDPARMSQFQQFRARPNVSPNADKALSDFTSLEASQATPPPGSFTLSDVFGATGAPTAATPAPASATPQAQAGGPQIGEVRKGYRFKGGDPSDKANWEKV